MSSEQPDDFISKTYRQIFANERMKSGIKIALELGFIVIWAMFVGRDYLDMNPRVVPAGREFGSSIQAHHLWTRVKECGSCAFWDGSERGGFPAFVDPLASALHPAVIITTLAFGVVNSAKIMVIFSLWMAGFAQWWLGRVLKLNWLPRIGGAIMVMVAGHLAGRMEPGTLCSIFSTAAVALPLAPSIRLSQTGKKRDAVILAVVLALMAVSGQGYMQVGFLFMLPAYLILIIKSEVGEKLLVKRYLLSATLALFLAAPFLVPFIHFWPNFIKDADPYFTAGQPLPYYLLNLFIADREYFYNTSLGKLPFPNMYTMYVGWIPIILAVMSPWFIRKKNRRTLIFLAVSGALALFFGSTLPLQWLQPIFPWVTALRFATMIGGLAVPMIIALASYALDRLLKLNWPSVALIFAGEKTPRRRGFNLSLLLFIPLLMAVKSGYDFSQIWLYTVVADESAYRMIDGLQTTDLQWVQPPFGEHQFIEPAVAAGMKLSPGIMTWRWEGRVFPIPVLEANRPGPPDEFVQQVDEIDGIPVYERRDQPYAAIYYGDTFEPCIATGMGGKLNVFCDSILPGKLIVKENTWTGWKAWIDGQRAPLVGNQWLEVETPPGEHTYQFRYQPWDVPLGLFLSFLGIVFSVYLWRAHPKTDQQRFS